MKIIKLYGVEYYRIDGATSYEIFRTLEEAEEFSYNKNKMNNIPLYIFSSNFNSACIFEENNGSLNYEDYADTLQDDFKIIKVLNKLPDYF